MAERRERPRPLTEVEEIARRVVLMVHELHRRGYQRLRIVPGFAQSNMYWRCSITHAGNIRRDHGALHMAEAPVARYSTGDGTKFFGWEDAADLQPPELADLFLERFPELAELGRGRDHAYAGWYVEMLGFVDRGEFPLAYDGWYFGRDNPYPGMRELPTISSMESGLPMPPPPPEPC